MVLVLRLIIRRIGDVRRNTEKFLNGEEVERFWVADDEVGGLQSLLLGASALVRERERELQVARDEAIAATQAKDEFLSRISHELRTRSPRCWASASSSNSSSSARKMLTASTTSWPRRASARPDQRHLGHLTH